ncbi:MAG: hypothetical protein E7166_00845 [Firmicutes bacterium]|nr:hypothetical protein [Bacillota bacterium]
MKTLIDAIKIRAIEYLNTTPVAHDKYLFIMYHTFANINPVPMKDDSGDYIYLDIINNEDDFKLFVNKMSDVILNAKDVSSIFSMIIKPYRFYFLKIIEDCLSKEDFNYYLKNIWINTEFPNTDKNVSVDESLNLFKNADKNLIMTKSELLKLNTLPDEITIYRGVHKKNNSKALSWTDDYEQALWFAKRFDNNGYVLQATIKKDDIIAYFDERNEKEIIVDFNKIYNLKTEKVIDIKI